jgi:hypothetical protein
MLPTWVTQLSSASKKAARRDSPEWTHTTDINELTKRTPDVSLANTARNTEERMASNAKITSPSTFGTTTTSAKTALLPVSGAFGVQNQIVPSQGQLK